MSLKVGEKGVALKVDEKAASHLNPALHAPGNRLYDSMSGYKKTLNLFQTPVIDISGQNHSDEPTISQPTWSNDFTSKSWKKE